MRLHRVVCITALLALLCGCAAVDGLTGSKFDRAEDLGLVSDTEKPLTIDNLLDAKGPLRQADVAVRDQFTETWMARSDYLCRRYKDRIIAASRNSRFATDFGTTVLAGLATIFTKIGTIHPLTGAATIVAGVGAAGQTDFFGQQTGDVIATAIQTARQNQANQISINLRSNDTRQYTIYRAQRDVIAYHNMCSMETALQEIRTALKQNSPDGGATPPAAQGGQLGGGGPIAPVQRNPSKDPGGPLITAEEAGRRIRSAATPEPRNTTPVAGANGPTETTMSATEVRTLQQRLCMPQPYDGTFLGPTRQAILSYREWADTPGVRDPAADPMLPREANAIRQSGDCDRGRFLNAYEKFAYAREPAVRGLQEKLNKQLAAAGQPQIPISTSIDASTRAALTSLFPESRGALTLAIVDKLTP